MEESQPSEGEDNENGFQDSLFSQARARLSPSIKIAVAAIETPRAASALRTRSHQQERRASTGRSNQGRLGPEPVARISRSRVPKGSGPRMESDFRPAASNKSLQPTLDRSVVSLPLHFFSVKRG